MISVSSLLASWDILVIGIGGGLLLSFLLTWPFKLAIIVLIVLFVAGALSFPNLNLNLAQFVGH